MATGPKPSSARAHSARSAYCGPATASNRPGEVRPTTGQGRPTASPHVRRTRTACSVLVVGGALSEHRGASRGGPSATEPRRGLHRNRLKVTTHWRDRVERLKSGPRKRAASKRISLAQRWYGGALASKVDLLGLKKQH
jgi:hypothetical protein